MKTVGSVALIAFLLTACASTDRIVLDSTKRPAKADVEVFMNGRTPEKHYKPIHEMSWHGPAQDEARAAKRFIEWAKQAGADGLIVYRPENKGVQWSGFGGETKFMFKATAFVYQP